MAFSATVRNVQYMGPGKSQLTGDWTGASGDVAGTMAVGGIVTNTLFHSYSSTNTWQVIPRVTVSVASGISTLTINNQDDVTAGYFTIDRMGG